MFAQINIIGLGLIGSSIARAVRDNKLSDTLIGCDANEVAVAYALKNGFIDKGSKDAAYNIAQADLVIIATPTGILEQICTHIAPHLKAGCVVMDTGSVKVTPLEIMLRCLPEHAVIIPAHPIAGSEQSGVSSGKADLFDKKRVIISPEKPLPEDTLQHIASFWQALGARVEAMPADMHDRIYGYISHLPQLLAYAATAIVSPQTDELLASQKLRQFTRLYASDTVLWSNILCLNSAIILPALDRYLSVITHIINELKTAPADAAPAKDDAENLTRTGLFPRIVASCLITTVMEAEKNSGLSFARYAGGGFKDFSAPSETTPEEDMEHISTHYRLVIPLLERFEKQLLFIRDIIEKNDEALLAESLK